MPHALLGVPSAFLNSTTLGSRSVTTASRQPRSDLANDTDVSSVVPSGTARSPKTVDCPGWVIGQIA